MSAKDLHLELQTPDGRCILHRCGHPGDAPLTEILRKAGVPLNTRCGQRGLCQGCLLELLDGQLVHARTSRILRADRNAANAHMFQACLYRSASETLILRVPPRSLLAYEPQVVSDFRLNVPRAHNPLWRQHSLPREQFRDERTLLAAAQHLLADDETLTLGPMARQQLTTASPCWVTLERLEQGWQITGLDDCPIAQPLGLAIDLGTTTIAVLLVNLSDGCILGRATDFNRQMHFGDDVLTRINLCSAERTMLGRLQHAVVTETLVPMIESLLSQHASESSRLVAITVAGNTTMLHLLAGADPSPMGVVPFTPRFLNHRVLSIADIGLTIPAAADGLKPYVPAVHLLPGAAAYVGADLTAGILASGLLYDEGPSLLVDVGTNGEIILKLGQHLLGCATAAGPAFEGVRLSSGMRAGAGAIEHLVFAGPPEFKVAYEVIGGGPPTGLCGSAYVDLLSQGRSVGLLGVTGRFNAVDAAGLGDRLMQSNGHGKSLRIACSRGKQPLVVTEADIAALLQAKAAIAAGILTLLHRLKLKPADLRTLYLAGGFGMHIDIANAIAAGLLPGFSPRQIQVVGNTSLGGAYLTLLDAGVLEEIKLAASSMEVVELNLAEDFESCFIDQLTLP